MTISLILNGRQVQAEQGQTLISVASEQGVLIPTLCYHKDLSPVGSCRMCLVEVEGMKGQTAACTLQVSDGMVVTTESPTISHTRKMVLELLLQNYYDSGYESTRGADTEFMHWVKVYGASRPKGAKTWPRYAVDSDSNPFIWVDFNKCILCTRCVRACAEIQGRSVWAVAERGDEAHIVAGAAQELLEARCESCGACVAYCPTGALDHRLSMNVGQPDRIVQTTCPYCGVGCQFNLNVKDGKVIRVTSNPDSAVNGMHLCVKGRFGYDFIHHADRLERPRVRKYLLEGRQRENGERGNWVEVDWDTALEITARKLRTTRDLDGPDAIGILTSAKCLNEENYLMNKFARQVIGTNNIDHCARL